MQVQSITFAPKIGEKTIAVNSKIPNTSPYSVADAPLLLACTFKEFSDLLNQSLHMKSKNHSNINYFKSLTTSG